MNKTQKRKKRIQHRLTIFVFLLLIFIGFFYYVANFIVLIPLLDIKTDDSLKSKIESLIAKRQSRYFLSKTTLMRYPYQSIDSSIKQVTMHRKFFLVWDLSVQKKINFRYILLNNQMRVLDQDSNLLDVFVVKEEILKQVPFILKIQISNKEPIEKKSKESDLKNKAEEKNVKSTEPAETKSLEQRSKETTHDADLVDETLSEIDLYKSYQSNVKPFIEYLFESNSSLGPKISLITYFPKYGLSFTLFHLKFIFGNRVDFSVLEQNIETCQTYLRKRNWTDQFTEFDFRYKNQIICRKNQ